MYDQKTYFFNNNLFWEFDDDNGRTAPGSPRPITSFWKGFSSAVFDAVLLWGWNWQLYFFKGNEYYLYDGTRVASGYPKLISAGWYGIPDNIDAAFSVSSLVTYFLKGNQVYKYDNYYDEVEPGYPKLISDVFGRSIPNDADAAFRYYGDGKVYFFKKEYYYIWEGPGTSGSGPYNTYKKWKNLCHV